MFFHLLLAYENVTDSANNFFLKKATIRFLVSLGLIYALNVLKERWTSSIEHSMAMFLLQQQEQTFQ